jgi:hypothetical protein
MAKESFFDQLSRGIADAVRDIREKVVEEPYFGRAVTDREPVAPQWPEAREPEASLGGFMRNIDVGPTRAQTLENANYRLAAEPERDRSADRDMDR